MKLEFNKLNHVHDLLDKVTMIRESPHQYLQLDASLPLYNYNIELPETKLIDNIDELQIVAPLERRKEDLEAIGASSATSSKTSTSSSSNAGTHAFGEITLSNTGKISLVTVFTLMATLLGVWLVKRRNEERRNRRDSSNTDGDDDFIIVPGSRVTY